MAAVWAWACSEMRGRRSTAVALAVLIAVSGAVMFTAAAGARRTASAFERFLDRSNTADVRLQYTSEKDVDDDVLAAVRGQAGVEVAAPVYITVAFTERSELDIPILAGPDPSLFRDVDRPRMIEGRMPDPDAADEAFVTRFARRSLDVQVGETVRFATFSPSQFGGDVVGGEPAGPALELTIVGVAATPYDVADPEFPGVFATTAFHDRYWGRVGGFGPSLEVTTDGARDPSAVVRGAVDEFEFDEVIFNTSTELTERVTGGTSVLATGLAIFAAVAGLAALVACAQALLRRIDESAQDQQALEAMGMSRLERSMAVAIAVAPVVLAGVVGAVLLAIAASPLMPVGDARTAEPDQGVDVDMLVLGVGGVVVTVILLAVCAAGALRISHGSTATMTSAGRSRAARTGPIHTWLSPPERFGVALALERGGGRRRTAIRSALFGAAIGVTGIAAALTFGSSLDALVDTPARWGWNWTVSPDIADESLADVAQLPGVDDVGRLVHRRVVVDGEQVLGIGVAPEHGSPSLTVVDGRMPVGPGEIALGPKLADRAGVGSGDVIVVDTSTGEREMEVVGEVLFPTFDDNPFNDAVAVDADVIDELARSEGFDQAIVGFDESVPTAEAARRVETAAPGSMSIYAFPSPPPDVAHLDGVRYLPPALALFLGLLALAAVAHALATSVQHRRRDLGVVRSLGFVASDMVRTMAAHSATLLLFGLAVGVPLGVIIGRLTWGVVAGGLGVEALPDVPAVALAALIVGALVASIVLAVLPGRAAARRSVSSALHAE